MRLLVHIIVSSALAVTLYPFYGFEALYLFLGGVLVDFDHYIWYFSKTRDVSLIRMVNYYDKGNFRDVLNIFHTIEFIILLSLYCLYFDMVPLYIGYVTHMSLDFIHIYQNKFTDKRADSLAMWIKRRV